MGDGDMDMRLFWAVQMVDSRGESNRAEVRKRGREGHN